MILEVDMRERNACSRTRATTMIQELRQAYDNAAAPLPSFHMKEYISRRVEGVLLQRAIWHRTKRDREAYKTSLQSSSFSAPLDKASQ